MNKNTFQKYLPHITAGLTLLFFCYCMAPRSDRGDDFNFGKFGQLLVIDGGRPKPIDTVARMNLMVIMHRQQFYDVDKSKTYPATKWMLDCLTTPLPNDRVFSAIFAEGARKGVAFEHKVFRIENDEVMKLVGVERRDGMRYSVVEIAPGWGALQDYARQVFGDDDMNIPGKKPKDFTLMDTKVVELWQHLNLYMKMSAHAAPLIVPNPDGSDQWQPFRDAVLGLGPDLDALPDTEEARAYTFYVELLRHYEQSEKSEFNKLLDKRLAYLHAQEPDKMFKVRVEIFFNEFEPFYRCLWLYALLAVIACASWLVPTWTRPIQNACFAAMGVAFVFHIFGLVLRMYLQDRMFVFVTNLYSSAVFIGLGCVLMCMIAELFYKNGIAIVVGSVTGFCTLIIAHMLSLSGDTMEMMQAVLDTNFWLATHVTCITLGYTTTFVAGFMGIAYIFLGIFTNMLRKDGSAELTRMTYGVLCAGMFLSFVGTVLGGLWADYSWGRFWGWDPKENGALLIVIWIALILHARWGGMVKHRGIAVLSVLGIIITSWSWFGTNFLGVGLHSYGFAQGKMMILVLCDLGFLSIALLGACLPLEYWTSFGPPAPPSNDQPLKPTIGVRPKSAGA
ncbi:MAG: hypothetical protein EXR98_14300 [Gemmataceae bacterium]|nr:hypothetical protein [Gemmataceae bacterium]